jgi:3-hydroxyacyl-[acyl-carrier-protein] dehydratase
MAGAAIEPGSVVDHHARPAVRVERIEALTDDAVTVTAIAGTGAACFQGHYPNHPIFPGVFTVELAHQAMRLFFAAQGPHWHLVDVGCRFVEPILPGAEIRCAVRCSRSSAGRLSACSECSVDGRQKATAKLVFAPAREPEPWRRSSWPERGERSPPLGPAAIKGLMPHRFPALLVDRINFLTTEGFVEGVKCLTSTDPCFGHLGNAEPDDAYEYPVSLLIESFGQACGVLVNERRRHEARDRAELMLAAGVSSFRLVGSARPGDQMLLHGRMTKATAGFAVFDGVVSVGDGAIAVVDTMIVAFKREDDDGR